MFSLFKRRPTKPPAVPEGVVVHAVGDVHGRADLLEPLLKAIWNDRQPGREHIVVFLGDYIDRGPDSPLVLDMLLQLKDTPGVTWRFLRGNHEQALLDFIENPAEAGPSWGTYGGRETLESYGVDAPYGSDPRLWRQARASSESRACRQSLGSEP
ncbi:MAG: serine/threonine protein phosphatase [Brevundimonas sp.]|nr:MAG: serine/threonine protein phosphatase [Brevundimonas sp.]